MSCLCTPPKPAQHECCVHRLTSDSLALLNRVNAIHNPRPTRPFKRGLIEVDSSDADQNYSTKRQCSSPSFPRKPPFRSRSDSFLQSSMSSRPTRTMIKPKRYRDDDAHNHQTNIAPKTAPLLSPSVSNYTVSFGPPPSTPNTIPSLASTSTTSRANHPLYRHDLRLNNILIDPTSASDTVIQHASEILRRERTSPGLSMPNAQTAAAHMRMLQQNADESAVKDVYLEHGIVPGPFRFPSIARGSNIPFRRTLPSVPYAPHVLQPKPDHHYGFTEANFDSQQDVKQSSSRLQQYSAPSNYGRWPFFTIEFKSVPKGGSVWAAENQNAGSGATLVHSLDQLLAIVDRQHQEIDTIVFSCTMDDRDAAFWAHYFAQETRQFCSVRIDRFKMENATDVIACRNTIRNIIDWGVKERLPFILECLDKVTIEYLQ